MSRIGRSPITVPAKVTVEVDQGNLVKVTGPKGTLTQQISPDLTIELNKVLFVLEAMKMQHELLSSVNGEVREVAATAGTQVTADDLLIDIEVDEAT